MSDQGREMQSGNGDELDEKMSWYDVVLLALGSEPSSTVEGVMMDAAVLSSQFGLSAKDWESKVQEELARAHAGGHIAQVGEGEWALTPAGQEALSGIMGVEEFDA